MVLSASLSPGWICLCINADIVLFFFRKSLYFGSGAFFLSKDVILLSDPHER